MSDGDEPKHETILPPNQVIESSRKLDIRESRSGSLSGKIANLTEDIQAFSQETHTVLDGISDKIATAREKREEAAEAHHSHYDKLIGDFQDSIDAVERLSNIPLEGGGKK